MQDFFARNFSDLLAGDALGSSDRLLLHSVFALAFASCSGAASLATRVPKQNLEGILLAGLVDTVCAELDWLSLDCLRVEGVWIFSLAGSDFGSLGFCCIDAPLLGSGYGPCLRPAA